MDGLSTASGVFAVASIAIQLGDGVNKLLKFLSAIQGAPARVDAICKDLTLLSSVLAQTCAIQQPFEFDGITERALENCNAKIIQLRAKIEKSSAYLSSSSRCKRSWSALKLTLKDDEIVDLRASVQQAQWILFSAQINTLNQLQRSNADTNQTVLTLVRSLQQPTIAITTHDTSKVETTMQITKQRSRIDGDEQHHDYTQSFVVPSPIDNTTQQPLTRSEQGIEAGQIIKWHRSSVKQRHPESRKYDQQNTIYSFYPPRLLSKLGVSYGMQILAKSTAGWQYSLQVFRAVPEDAPIFQFCRDGNLAAVRSLLATGYASTWDRDPAGRTPLWVAAHSLKLDVAELLLREGADSQAAGGSSQYLPITVVRKSDGVEINPKIAMIRLLQKYCGEGYEDEVILSLNGIMLFNYRVHKDISMTVTQRWDAALKIVQQLLPDFAPDDPYRTAVLDLAIDFCYDKDVLRWQIRNINGALYELSDSSCIHRAISKSLLRRDPISMKLITLKTKNLHRVFKTRTGLQTPTSLAMFQSSVFFAWRNLLRDIGYDVQQFVRQELDEDILGKVGWTVQSLISLFEYDFLPYEGKQILGFPECERCGENGTEIFAPMKIDLEWRRLLRDIRLGREPYPSHSRAKEIRSITVNLGSSNSSIPHGNENLECGQLAESKTHEFEGKRHSRAWPYRIVCSEGWSGGCQDEVCVAWVYENDSAEEPQLPPYVAEERITENIIQAVETSREDENSQDKCPSRMMPGAFRD